MLRGRIAFAVATVAATLPRSLLKAAKRLEPLDARLAREIYLDALSAALFAGRLASEGGLLEVAQAARVAAPSPDPGRAADLLLDGLALVITQGDAAGACLEAGGACLPRRGDVERREPPLAVARRPRRRAPVGP